jgi:predicted O-methyltransferase YrrM
VIGPIPNQSLGPRHEHMRALVNNLPRPAKVLEVGSWVGCSALTWSEALDDSKSIVLCIDPYKPYFSDWDVEKSATCKAMNEYLKADQVCQAFWENTKHSKTPIRLLRAKLSEVAHLLSQFDLIYIDGSHYYPEVLEDLTHAGPLVNERGYLCGDDLELQMHEVNTDHGRRDISRHNGISFHPGVTKSVWEYFQRTVSSYEGFWVMQKRETWENVAL